MVGSLVGLAEGVLLGSAVVGWKNVERSQQDMQVPVDCAVNIICMIKLLAGIIWCCMVLLTSMVGSLVGSADGVLLGSAVVG